MLYCKLKFVYLELHQGVSSHAFSHSESDEVWYYSSKPQLDELMDSLDRHLWEADLIDALEEFREVIEKQMSATETLSREKGVTKKSYLECQNGERAGSV